MNSVVELVRRNGNDATDLRDAAHEACHAIDCNVPPGEWGRETINQYVLQKYQSPSDLVSAELLARAVEWRVCEFYQIPYDLQHWAHMAWMETMKNAQINTPIDFWESGIRLIKDSGPAEKLELEVRSLVQDN